MQTSPEPTMIDATDPADLPTLIRRVSAATKGMSRHDRRLVHKGIVKRGIPLAWTDEMSHKMGLYKPNPTKGLVVAIPGMPYDAKKGLNVRAVILGALRDGVPAQVAAAKAGNKYR